MTSVFDRENRQTFASHAGEDEHERNVISPQKHHHNTSGIQQRKVNELPRDTSRSTKRSLQKQESGRQTHHKNKSLG
jgi:hypothetical protein